MYDRELAAEIVAQMLEAIGRIERRTRGMRDPAEFFAGDAGLDRLDAVCMVLIALGESCKNLDKVTAGELLSQYPQVDWRGVTGMRDILSHHYFDIDPEIVGAVCSRHIPGLKSTLQTILQHLAR